MSVAPNETGGLSNPPPTVTPHLFSRRGAGGEVLNIGANISFTIPSHLLKTNIIPNLFPNLNYFNPERLRRSQMLVAPSETGGLSNPPPTVTPLLFSRRGAGGEVLNIGANISFTIPSHLSKLPQKNLSGSLCLICCSPCNKIAEGNQKSS